MVPLTFTFQTGAVPVNRILDAFAVVYNYQETIDGVPNKETKAQFAKRMLKEHIIEVVKTAESLEAQRIARESIISISIE